MQTTSHARLWADESGESHFEDVAIDLQPIDFAPPAPPLDYAKLGESGIVGLVSGEPSWGGDVAHPSPNRQFMCVLSGEFTSTASDGERRSFGPGALLLLDDTHGKGHTTQVTSEEPAVVLVVTLSF